MPRYNHSPIRGPDIPREVNKELLNVEAALITVNDFEASREVQKPRPGMIRYFDATVFDPGQGTGVYAFINDIWERLALQSELPP